MSAVIDATKAWLQQFVIDLNLCPFAGAPFRKALIRYRVEATDDLEVLLTTLLEEMLLLDRTAPEAIETTLVIHPHVLTAFGEYNQFLRVADAVLQEAGLEGVLQIASFHPDYQFAGTTPEAAENYTNRSPYPMLHLLRESSIDRAIEHYPHPEGIPKQNIATLRKIGIATLRQRWQELFND